MNLKAIKYSSYSRNEFRKSNYRCDGGLRSENFKHKPDFAVTNGGGIRASISKGKVTQNDIITVLPFGNLISQIKVKGTNVKEAFEHSLGSPTETKDGKKQLSPNGGFLQVSKSIRVYYDMNQKSGSRVRDIQVRNRETGKFEKLNPNKTYYVVTNDFTANKGDGYDMFGGQREEGISLDEVVGNYIQKHNLNKYNTNNPERIINGKLDSVKNQHINQTMVNNQAIILTKSQPKYTRDSEIK